MLSSRLPTELIARLLLALVIVCNLTLCVSWHGMAADEGAAIDLTAGNVAVPQSHEAMGMEMPMADDLVMAIPCHDSQASPQSQGCQMHGGLTTGGAGIPLLAALLTLFALPLLLMPRSLGALLDQWLRDPLLRLRGTHPPSWPRRHLMLSVLRH